jgi:glucose uptake protein GlcU
MGVSPPQAGLIGILAHADAVKWLTTMAIGSGALATVIGTHRLASGSTPEVAETDCEEFAYYAALALLVTVILAALLVIPLQWFHVD